MSNYTATLLEAYRRRRATGTRMDAPLVDPRRRAYRLAAAVLHRFSPATLRPFGFATASDDARIVLFEDIERAPGEWSEGLFSLKATVRRAALAELRTRKAMRAALEANPDHPSSDIQVLWERYLRSGSFPRPELLSYRELNNLAQILEWLQDLDLKGRPSLELVLELARRRSVLAGFEHLVRSDFTGRRRELAALREHVQASSADRGSPPILAVYGPGGIGKTALVGRLLIEQAQVEAKTRVPFAYLTFDHGTLRIEEPFGLLLEAAAQFDLQLPEMRPAVDRFRVEAFGVRGVRADIRTRRHGSVSRGARISQVRSLDARLYDAFARLVMQIARRVASGRRKAGRVLVVFDTFEEVQYRDRESLVGFWRMLASIAKACPAFRVVISGRGPVSELGGDPAQCRELPLAELDPDDRIRLLTRLGVKSTKIAEAVAAQVGGSPLSLQLAARVLRSDPQAANAKGIQGVGAPRLLSVQVDQELIQGQLYERLLDHIHDENVRKLAHPGMVLRRVTADAILKVLAPQLLEGVTDENEAQRLFGELRREHALVTFDEGALVYRPEIRRAMVRLLEQDRFGSVRALHRAAVRYYEPQSGLLARAEELYHRLALGEDPHDLLDSRWLQGIESSVVSGVAEYPDVMKAWLASRANLEVPRSVFLNAGTADWERNTTRKVQRALVELQTDIALALLGERTERTLSSPLFALEAKAHLLRNALGLAARTLRVGIECVSESNNRGRLAELLWLQAQVQLLQGEPASADRSLAQAESALTGADNPIPIVHVLSHRLLLRKQYPAAYVERTPALRARLDQASQRLDATRAYEAEFVVRLARDLLEQEYPSTTARLAALVDVQLPPFTGDPLTSENLRGLDEFREPWEIGQDAFGSTSTPSEEEMA